MKRMKNICKVTAILLIFCGKVESTLSSHLRGRDLHKDIVVRYKDHPQPEPEDDEDLDLCIDLGRKYGKHTFTIPKEDVSLFKSIGATNGVCDRGIRKDLSKRQQSIRAYCIEDEDITLYAPRAASRLLARNGIRRRACSNRGSIEVIEMNLREVDDRNMVVGNKWKLEEADGLGPPLDTHPITLTFDETSVFGRTGCNNAKSNLSLFTDSQLRIGRLATTRKFCHPSEVMNRENSFVRLMSNAFYYDVLDSSANDDIELLLYEVVLDEDWEEVKGDLVARFSRVLE